MPDFKLITLLALSLLSMTVLSFAMPLFTANTNSCVQVNSSYLVCPEGSPVSVAIAVTAPDISYYGNFTATSTNQNASVIYNSYGLACKVPFGSTMTCFAQLAPISMLLANGSETKVIGLKLTSSNYPQISYNDYFKITLQYYASNETLAFASMYNSSLSNYTAMSTAYDYACSTYGICNSSISSNLTQAYGFLSLALTYANSSNGTVASANARSAASLLQALAPKFQEFKQQANQIINTVTSARAHVSNSTSLFNSNRARLMNCTFSNGTSYYSKLSDELASLNTFTLFNTLARASAFSSAATTASEDTKSLVRACASSASPSFNLSLPKNSLQYAAVLLVIILLAYMVRRYMDEMEVREVRGEPKHEQKTEKPPSAPSTALPPASESPGHKAVSEASAQPEKAHAEPEAEKSAPYSLEDSFNDWLSKTTGAEINTKHDSEETPKSAAESSGDEGPKIGMEGAVIDMSDRHDDSAFSEGQNTAEEAPAPQEQELGPQMASEEQAGEESTVEEKQPKPKTSKPRNASAKKRVMKKPKKAESDESSDAEAPALQSP